MNLEYVKFFVGAMGLIALTITALVFIWYEKDINALGYFALAFGFLASASKNIKDIEDVKKFLPT